MIMDNLKAHKGERGRELIEARGCEKLALAREALSEAISEAISMVLAQDARGFFGYCGGYH